MKKDDAYIPAFHFHWLTPWYDPIVGCLFAEVAVKEALIAQAGIQSGHSVLDVGCGTGTLALLIKKTHPDAAVHGLDVDQQILDIARRKAGQAGDVLILQQGTATDLPYPDGCFDHVFTSLMLHHLKREQKRQAFGAIFRVLKSGGELHVADFGEPQDTVMWLFSLLIRWAEEIHDNIQGLLPVFMVEAGFRPVVETARYRTVFGAIALHKACKPIGDVL
ncbi:class I SAM-dependent methyltransferase [Methylococcus sp. EFPC2]|uniref:class I SAM-dependent methyltransferase n=1 Tax=Methylococcus sp. EFPC2 TaxID=2812648 RepID=UPI001966EE11|nr:class I SAM-dependent methyltransferase [Methylococcus sp. EFPC2]QSA98099.1 methyltransferase domain-containing protein [Methylococcus sp. EFPC2]